MIFDTTNNSTRRGYDLQSKQIWTEVRNWYKLYHFSLFYLYQYVYLRADLSCRSVDKQILPWWWNNS